MKSEERHELEKNILADRIGTGIQATRPILPLILGGIAVAAVGAIGWGLYSAGAQGRSAVAWTDYYFNLTTSNEPDSYFNLLSDVSARDADAFLDVAERFPSSAAAGWAQQSAGSRFLDQGIEALYRNRAEGETLLNQAIESFGAAAESKEPALRTRAQYGLGRAYEALSKLDDAAAAYEQVIESTSLAELAEDAKRRLEFVTSPDGKEFYGWFAKLDPKPDAPIRLPGDLSAPPTNPSDMSFDPINFGLGDSNPLPSGGETTVPDSGDRSLPSTEGLQLPSIPLPSGSDAPPVPADPAADSSSGLELSPPAEPAAAEPAADSGSTEAPVAEETGASTEVPGQPANPPPSASSDN